MIKVGIYGSASLDDPVRKQLLRLLLRHPDVELMAVASPAGNTAPLCELYPVYAGETNLTLERKLNLDGLDVLFVIDEENITEEILEKYRNDPDFRLIVLGYADRMRATRPSDFTYGLCEWNRKELVRTAKGAYGPRAEAMLTELALLPLAKEALLLGGISGTMATNRPATMPDACAEAETTLAALQPGFDSRIAVEPVAEAPFDRLDVVLHLDTPLALEEIERIYTDFYDDHNFVWLLPNTTHIDEDMRGSNKCLLQLSKEGQTLTVKGTLDALTKGCTGNAVHIMDLLFGLYERTGLSI